MNNYVIWWTNPDECSRIKLLVSGCPAPNKEFSIARWPEYLSRAFEARSNNNGMRDLWVAKEFRNDLGEPDVTCSSDNTLWHIAALASGIVIRTDDASHVFCLPGFLTTFEMTTPTIKIEREQATHRNSVH